MNMKFVNQIKNENVAVKRTRVVCYGHKDAYRNVNFGSHMTLRHGPDYKDDHNVIQVLADGVVVGNVIHRKLKPDKICNIYNNDEIIHLVEDGMTVNLVVKRGNQLIIDIPAQKEGLI